uniref:Duf300 domain-containing protein n=1 Tax=Tetraselmis sp. GSL018 TaxID=582737 RepID=A0A061SHK4_9CHLO
MAELRSFRDASDTVFLLAALVLSLISFALIWSTFRDHLRNYKYPSLQMCCLRILALAPVYALSSWLMMVLLPQASYIEVLRDVYETYSLYCYWVILVLWVGGQRRAIEILAAEGPSASDCMMCPLLPAHGCPKFSGLTLARFQNAMSHFRYWRLAIFQWMAIKPTLTLVHSVLLSMRLGGLNSWRAFTLLSTFVGMHGVLDTYSCLLPYLRGLQGSIKFLCIKLLVGVTLLQQALVNALLGYGAIPEEPRENGYTAPERAQRLLSTITIVEMSLFSWLLSYVFSRHSLQRLDSELPARAKSKLMSQQPDKAAAPEKPAGDPEHPLHQVMHGTQLSSGDVVSRQVRVGQAEGSVPNWDTEIEAEDDLGGRVSFRQILALWDVVTWRTVEDRHAWALAGRTSPPPEREAQTSPACKKVSAA